MGPLRTECVLLRQGMWCGVQVLRRCSCIVCSSSSCRRLTANQTKPLWLCVHCPCLLVQITHLPHVLHHLPPAQIITAATLWLVDKRLMTWYVLLCWGE